MGHPSQLMTPPQGAHVVTDPKNSDTLKQYFILYIMGQRLGVHKISSIPISIRKHPIN